jgi:hypothetical protein
MILFDQLKISDNGKEMYINFHVNGATYFRDIYLESLTIMTADQVSETEPLTPTANFIYKLKFGDGVNIKEYNTVITKGVLDEAFINWNGTEPIDPTKAYANTSFTKENLSSDLFFVYVKCKDAPLIGCPPCRLDESTTLGVTFDEALLHQKVLGYTNELVAECSVPQGFTDFILLWYAFKSAVETEHYIMAKQYWKMLFDDYSNSGDYINSKSGCGCHGKNRL